MCGGAGAVYECGCTDIPTGDCDCDGNQLDENGICGEICEGDLNGDDEITVADLLLLLQAWGSEADYAAGDFDGNGFISILDVLTMLEVYGTNCF